MKKYICKHTYYDGTTAEWTGTVAAGVKALMAGQADTKSR